MRLYRARQRFRILYRELDRPDTPPVGGNECYRYQRKDLNS